MKEIKWLIGINLLSVLVGLLITNFQFSDQLDINFHDTYYVIGPTQTYTFLLVGLNLINLINQMLVKLAKRNNTLRLLTLIIIGTFGILFALVFLTQSYLSIIYEQAYTHFNLTIAPLLLLLGLTLIYTLRFWEIFKSKRTL